ncbi:MAG: amidohydrolase family protein [Ilumatobacteraceae bacterium]
MELIDAQTHAPDIEWIPADHASIVAETAVRMCVLAMDSVGVDRALLHVRPEFCRSAAALAPDRFRSVVLLDPTEGPLPSAIPARATDCLEETVGELVETAGVVGIRILLGNVGDPSDKMLTPEQSGPLVQVARSLGLPVCGLALGRPVAIGAVAREHPDVTFVVDHLALMTVGLAGRADVGLLAELPAVLELSCLPNVTVKLSGLPRLSRVAFPYSDVWPVVRQVIEAFGVERTMWGSDHTHDPSHSYADSLAVFRDSSELTEVDKAWIFGRSLRRAFPLAWPS